MNVKRKRLNTEELINFLDSSLTFMEVLQENKDSIDDPTLQTYLAELMSLHKCTPAQVIQRTNLSKSFVYQVFNGERLPNRDIVLRIAFAMKLNLDETQSLLIISRRGELYPRIRRDAAIIFCLQKNYDLDQTSELLEGIGEVPLI